MYKKKISDLFHSVEIYNFKLSEGIENECLISNQEDFPTLLLIKCWLKSKYIFFFYPWRTFFEKEMQKVKIIEKGIYNFVSWNDFTFIIVES